MSHKIEKIASCTCGCHLIRFEKWTDDDDAFMEVYENSFYSKQDGKIRSYFERLWSSIRGKEYRLFEIVLSHDDIIGLRNTLVEATISSNNDTQIEIPMDESELEE